MPASQADRTEQHSGRRANRRDTILAAAAEHFARKGFVATGIDEIGTAAGISGPGVYRYFSSKDEILKSLIEKAVDRLFAVQASPLQSSSAPNQILERMVEELVHDTTEDAALAVILWTEQRHLAPETRSWVRRLHRLRTAEWVHVLSRVRPDKSDLELMTIVDGVYGLVRFGALQARSLDPDRTKAILKDMALRALLVQEVTTGLTRVARHQTSATRVASATTRTSSKRAASR
jgi:AcrR family transcriptional regulator